MLKRFASRGFASSIKLDRSFTRKMSAIDVTGDTEKLNMKIPNPIKTNIDFNPNNTFAELKDKLIENHKDIEDVRYFDVDGNLILLNEKVQNWQYHPILMNINGKDTYALNFNMNYYIDPVTQEMNRFNQGYTMTEENLLQSLQTIGLTGQQSYLLANYASKIQKGLVTFDSKKIPISEVYRLMNQLKLH